MIRILKSFAFLTLIGQSLSACADTGQNSAACLSSDITVKDMERAKANAFETLDTRAKANMATSMVACLGHPDPAIRDGIAYAGLTALLRSGTLPQDDIRALRDQLLVIVETNDADGYSAPFAALVLSEVARTDRVEPYLTDSEFDQLVQAAATYVNGVTDYRGFSDTEGWRHGIAHGADWLMQLSLNPALTDDHANILLKAIQTQIPSGNGHIYIHGEPGRLARPVLFIAMQQGRSEQAWTEWLAPLIDPAPMSEWGEAYKSEAGLARLHNVKSFLQALYVAASLSSNTEVKPLIDPVTEALRALP
ncbi:DUF2785 domain-containing protein [Algimonas arctica]|nr:DUF2785 domain-containing protein [Algimonas arctica]